MNQATIPKLSIIIPHLKGLDILRDCLLSIYNSTFRDFEVILVDNGSTDGSREMVTIEFPEVKQIKLNENRGYAGGCNVGLRSSAADLVLLLNDDTVIAPEAIAALVETMENDPELGGAQPGWPQASATA